MPRAGAWSATSTPTRVPGVHQSRIDSANPMIALDGHVALIVPDFALRPIDAREVGVHRYDGDGWKTWTGKDAARRLFIRRFV